MTSVINGSHEGFKLQPKCHESHKELQFGDGVLLGAACAHPRKGYDIYIGFDGLMKLTQQTWPWMTNGNAVIEFEYRITDMCAPKSPKDFKNMVNWIVQQLKIGKKIHIGCIGGHGRTGLVISAVKKVWDGTEDATTWTRAHHCEKAVESTSQVNFLFKHFGITKVTPTKQAWTGTQTGRISGKGTNTMNAPKRTTSKGVRKTAPLPRKDAPEQIRFVVQKGSIWG